MFIPLHVHSEHSLLDGISKIRDLAREAKAKGMTALGLTDHGRMSGAIELIKTCKSEGIKPIIGNEMYILNETASLPSDKKKYFHLVVLAKNTEGYHNLTKLTTASHLSDRHPAKPVITLEEIANNKEGLIITTACLGGEIPQLILAKIEGKSRHEEYLKTGKVFDPKKNAYLGASASKAWADNYENLDNEIHSKVLWYKETFPEFYLELQYHGNDRHDERALNQELVRLGEQHDIPLIITNDSHFTRKSDYESHRLLKAMEFRKKWKDEVSTGVYTGEEYFKSEEEMTQMFIDHLPCEVIEKAMNNTEKIAESVTEYEIFKEAKLPQYPVSEGYTQETYLSKISLEGLKELSTRQSIDYSKYEKRLQIELEVICSKGFAPYFLIVWDYIKYARDNDIPVGPGRGSAAGSLVAYVLGITNVDPVHHGLLFERFLNPERVSMPDIDTDFCVLRRNEVIQYLANKYGENHVAQIGTYGQMLSKSAFTSVVNTLGLEDSKKLSKMSEEIRVSRGQSSTIADLIKEEGSPFKDLYESPYLYPLSTEEKKTRKSKKDDTPLSERRLIKRKGFSGKEILNMAMNFEGVNKSAGVHASGVILSYHPLDQIVPLQKNDEGKIVTQYTMGEIEELGLLKMDFLGSLNLTTIKATLDTVKDRSHKEIDLEGITLKESLSPYGTKADLKEKEVNIVKAYELLSEGTLAGVFQLESSGMIEIVRKLRPSNLGDISSVLALYRPGPLDAGLIPMFINRKHGKEDIKFDHPGMKNILEETYGVLVFQEQIMKIAQELAGYSLGEADIMRKAIGKKKMDIMKAEKEKFVNGAKRKGIEEEQAEQIFDQIEKFAAYCFNKSHSMAYAHVTFQTAYLKANYPVEYMAALLTSCDGDLEKQGKYVREAIEMGIRFEKPDINLSKIEWEVIGNQTIRIGLSAVKGLGIESAKALIKEREDNGKYEGIAEVRTRGGVNSKAFENLVYAGALDNFLGENRESLREQFESVDEFVKEIKKGEKSKQEGQGLLIEVKSQYVRPITLAKKEMTEDEKVKQRIKDENEVLGFRLTEDPLEGMMRQIPDFINQVKIIEIKDKEIDDEIVLVGWLSSVRNVETKRGDTMAFIKVNDGTKEVSCTVFPNEFNKCERLLILRNVVVVSGRITTDKYDNKIVIVNRIRNGEEFFTLEKRYISLDADRFTGQEDLSEMFKFEKGTQMVYLKFAKIGQMVTTVSLSERGILQFKRWAQSQGYLVLEETPTYYFTVGLNTGKR